MVRRKIRALLVRWIPSKLQVWTIHVLSQVARRLLRHPVITYRGNRIHLLPGDQSSALIFVSFFFSGYWKHEPGAQEIVERLISARAGRVYVVDGGASFGMYSFLAASLPNVSKVVAVEAAEDTLKCLQQSVAENRSAGRIECVHAGLVDRLDRRIANAPKQSQSEWDKVLLAQIDNDSDGAGLAAITVDALVAGFGLAAEDALFVKLDVEGSEVEAVVGMRDTLAAARDSVFMIEFHAGLLNRRPGGAVEFARTLWASGMSAIYAINERDRSLRHIPDRDTMLAMAERLGTRSFPDNLENLILVKQGLGTTAIPITAYTV